MSQQNPWSIKGIKAGNREAAKELAGKHGVTIGELINNLIEEAENGHSISDQIKQAANSKNGPFGTHSFESTMDSFPNQSDNLNFASNFGATEAVSNMNSFHPTNQNGLNQNMQNQNSQMAETSRLAQAMENLNRNLANIGAVNNAPRNFQEAANFNAPFGSNPNSDSYSQRAFENLVSRLDDSERRTDKTLSQLNLSLSDIRQAQENVADRLRRIEQSDPTDRALLALRNLENSLARMASQLAENENKTIGLERKFEAEKQNRLTPDDVEKILSQNTSQLFSKFDTKIGELNTRLGGVEELASSSIEQTDKGISLLSERIKDTEASAQNTNQSLREALLELSARLSAVEHGPSLENTNQELQKYAAKFAELEAKINSLDENIGDLIEQTNATTNARFTEIAATIGDRLLVSEGETLRAIENVSGQLVNTVHNLDDRLKAVENLNNGSRDNATAMKLELGRITHAVNEQLEQLQAREADFVNNAGKHINSLAEQVNSRLEKLEASSENIIDKIGTEVKAIADTLLRRQTEASEDFNRKIAEADERLNQRFDEKFGALTREMLAIEDRAKSATEPLMRNFDQILDRMDRLEAQNPNSSIAQIEPPEFNYNAPESFEAAPIMNETGFGIADKSLEPFGNLASDDEREFGDNFSFKSDEPIEEKLAKFEEVNLAKPTESDFSSEFGKDFNDIANQSEFAPDFPVEEFGDDELNGEFVDFEIDTPIAQSNDPWIAQIEDDNSAPIEKADYLSRARRAAIEAAEFDKDDNRRKKERKPIKKPAKAEKPRKPDIIYDENGKPIEAKKAKSQILTPVAIAAASALVLSSAAIGYKFYNNSKQINQNELPAALQNGAASPVAAPIAPAPQTAPNMSAPAGAPVNGHAAPTEATNPPVSSTPITATPSANTNIGAEQKKTPAAIASPTAKNPTTNSAPIAAPIAKPSANAANKNQFIAVNPAQGNLRPNAVKAPVAATPNPKAAQANTGIPRIASAANAGTGVSANGANSRQLYEQAMQKLQAGDNSAAIVLLTRASDGGDTKATNRLARMYERGEGVTRDLSRARRLTERAAAAGSREAQHNLGVYYVDEGPGRDLAKAADNFRRAAKRGLADSQYNLAAMAEQGNGVPKNEREAYFWYSVAGRNGDSDASKKASELASRLTPAAKNEEDRRVSSFRVESGGPE